MPILFYEGYVGVQPTIISLSRSLAGDGFRPVVYARRTSFPAPPDLGPGSANCHLAAESWISAGLQRIASRAPQLSGAARLASVVTFAARVGGRELLASCFHGRPAVVVAVDLWGTVAATIPALLLRRPFLFVSLELKDDPRKAGRIMGVLAALGSYMYRKAVAITVQAEDRLEALRVLHRFDHPRVYVLPNAPQVTGANLESRPRSLLFRERLGIQPGRQVALQAGMINDLTCARKLALCFSSLPAWLLVLHERHERPADEPYLDSLRQANPRNLLLSLKPVAYDDLPAVFGAADIGLVFYDPDPNDQNFTRISSSGKMAQFLAAGRPVLVSALPALRTIVDRFGCGLAIRDPTDPAEVGCALDRIMADYQRFSANARNAFLTAFDFDVFYKPVGELISHLSAGGQREAQAADF